MPGMKCNAFPATAIAENTATAAQTHRFWADCRIMVREFSGPSCPDLLLLLYEFAGKVKFDALIAKTMKG
jgi:hypothetical protein